MTEMTARVRNRLQDGVINWQERRFQKEDFRQQQADIHRSRMTCSSSLKPQDWTGGMAMSPSGRFRVIEERKPRIPAVSGDGIRWNVALTVLILASLILCAILLADLAGMGNSGRMIAKLGSRIQTIETRNEELKTELEMCTDSATVCTGAVKMDLISSNGAQTIRLTAPQEARITLTSASEAAENADLEIRMMSYAGD